MPLQLGSIEFNNKEIAVSINEKPFTFNNVFLRDASRSPDSVDPISSQKLFTTAEGATNLSINSPPLVDSATEPALKVQWNNDGKIIDSSYPVSFLERYSTPSGRRDRKLWDKQELESNLESLQINYEDILNKEESFFQALYNLNRYGLTFVNNIPHPELTTMSEDNSAEWPVFKIASRFGYIKKTFYGTLFDVKNQKDKAVNIAYTNTFLPLHMDLLYYESPQACSGENIFCDSFLAAEHVRKVDPAAYTALTKIPITYHYDNNNEYYYYKRPLIIEDAEIGDGFPEIAAINYAPPFQGHWKSLFETYINEPENHFEIKMPEGSCVIFENRRALHSRNEFSDLNNGDRWLMGTY
ncbi:putative oxidoreductase AIM17 [Candida viswanathii]|uniref:Putative oxidoreductase AIM17 n=1 Tax=Candida viswanathii TaxID=5486 RepID=A0A367YHT6_9ASCO|nr:putative oxidoreductase AIM17 [Candida viswanathii]